MTRPGIRSLPSRWVFRNGSTCNGTSFTGDFTVFPFWIDLHLTLPQGMTALFGATFLMTHFVLARR